ncbi:hypothetical protein [Pseudonocardia kunmingensis]|uniref:Uncharacterized protein n=1 Tax=Pseudonocardia kunmingensis TaxID=630975 RepID=A0A543DKU6_9PSEU|nr:hypothetical protein [Pseudonocardia kunmingensis]TQM09953.1 hypothetical protein FB558_5731 [Pseudonocardia kunmingensis]
MADSSRAPRRAGMLSDFDSRLSLVVGATVTVVVAVLFDVLAGEHPTHTLVLALVVLVVAGLRLWLGGRREGLLSVVSGAVVAQPALHATAKLDSSATHHVSGGLLHIVVADGPGAAMQLAVSAAVVIAVATSGRIAQLLLTALRRPVRLLVSGPPPPALVRSPACLCVRPHGSMLHWCGWSIQAARRGPPRPSFA